MRRNQFEHLGKGNGRGPEAQTGSPEAISYPYRSFVEQVREIYAQIGYYQGEFLTLALSPVLLKSV